MAYPTPSDLCAGQLLLTRRYELAGGFSYPRVTNEEIREVQREGRIWLREARLLIRDILSSPLPSPLPPLLPSLSTPPTGLSSIPGLLDSYDMLHRISHGAPCHDYLREVKLQTVDRWVRGDRSISQTDVVLLLLSEVDRDIRTLDRRYIQYALTMLEKWVRELTVHGRFTGIPLPEARRRLDYLLRTDLTVFLGSKDQSKIKSQWTHVYATSPKTGDHKFLVFPKQNRNEV